MKIAIIGTISASILGFRLPLIKELIKQGHTVYAFAIDYSDKEQEILKNIGVVPVLYKLSRFGVNPLVDIYYSFKLKGLLQGIAPDVVLSYFVKPVVFASFAAKLAGVPKVIAMLEGLGYAFTQQPNKTPIKTIIIRKIQILLYKLILPKVDNVIFLNKDDPVDLLVKNNIKVKCCKVIGAIGLELDEYPFSKTVIEPFSFIFIGRLLAEKGVNEYLQAAKIVKQRYPFAEFIVLGAVDGIKNDKFIQQITSLVKKNIIIYPGQVDNVADWIRKSSVFVLPSYREGMSRSIQEAMAIGRAIITTDVAGCREMVKNNINGFLVQPFSTVELANKMIHMLENKSIVSSMGQESHKFAVKNYDVNLANKKIIDIISA